MRTRYFVPPLILVSRVLLSFVAICHSMHNFPVSRTVFYAATFSAEGKFLQTQKQKFWNLKTMEKKGLNVLVLGMLGILPHQYDSVTVAKQLTFPPALRDFYRLQSLQKLVPNAVIYTLNRQGVSGIKEQPTHIYANINRRGALSLNKSFPLIQFHYILLDYMRFPGEYMVLAYGEICSKNGFLDTLRQKGHITASTEIWIPHLRGKDPFCTNDQKIWNVTPASPGSNPLVVATSILQVQAPQLLGGLTNQNELALLDKESPFIKVTSK